MYVYAYVCVCVCARTPHVEVFLQDLQELDYDDQINNTSTTGGIFILK